MFICASWRVSTKGDGWALARAGGLGGGWNWSRSHLMSMTLSTINFVESQRLNSISKERLERVYIHHRAQKSCSESQAVKCRVLLCSTTLKLHSASIPPLQNYTRMCCVSQNQYILTCCSFSLPSMNRRVLFFATKRCLRYCCECRSDTLRTKDRGRISWGGGRQ